MAKAKSTTSKKPVTKKKPAPKKPIKKPILKKAPKVAKKAPKTLPKVLPKTATKKAAPKASKKSSPKPSAKVSSRPQGAISISEVEIIRRDSDKVFSGRKIQSVEVLNAKALVSPMTQGELKKLLIGNEIITVNRYGVSIVLEFPKNVGWLSITLGEGGQIRKHSTSDAKDNSCALIFGFTKGGQLRINSHLGDTKIRFLKPEKQSEAIFELKGSGLDLIDSPIPKEIFVGFLRNQAKEKTIKEVLLDFNFAIGLGDVYSDEALHKSGLKYNRTIGNIPDIKLILLLRNLSETLYEAMKYRGTTLENGFFCDITGQPGTFQEHLQVYGRDGELTSILHDVEKKRFQNRWTYYCPAIQQ